MTLDARPQHPVLACLTSVAAAVKDVGDVEPTFMTIADKRVALTGLTSVITQLEELRMRVLAEAGDVAEADASRDAAVWLDRHTHVGRSESRRRLRLAQGCTRWPGVRRALREGRVTVGQAEVVVRALDDLPAGLDDDVPARAEAELLARAAELGPRRLRTIGRNILEVVAPEVGERHEQRLLTYLDAFTSPRRAGSGWPEDRRGHAERLGHAFGTFLEAVDPDRLPLHGGDATTLLVTVALETLRDGLGTALVGDTSLSASEARRLACTAGVVPVVLGGASQVLDLGRTRRLFSPAQRKALAVRQPTCAAEGCDAPAAWCEAHHAEAWSRGGRTDLRDGVLLCSFHHHRAHDPRHRVDRLPDGGVRFHRRT